MYHQILIIRNTQFVKLRVNLRCFNFSFSQQTESSTPITASQVSPTGFLSHREAILNLSFVIASYIAAANLSNATKGICSIT